MNTKKEKLLNDTYYKWIQTVLYDLPLDGANDFVDPEIMGYGTAIDEKVLSISDYREMVNRQREQAVGLEMSFEITPVFRSISNKEDSAIFVDEIKVSIIFEEGKQELFLRLTTILEHINSKWIVVHLHGSMPTETTAETDTWLVNEWQRKNEQLQKLVDEKTSELSAQNRELEIEASLERVRTVAMSMHKSDDLLSICEVSFKEFQKLGFENIRNAIIHIPNDQQKYFMDYDFSEFTGEAITKIEYNSHPIVDDYLEKIRSAKDAYFEVVIEKDQLEGWKDFRKKSGQKDDPRLDEATAIYYYVFSIGVGDIGISTFKPIEDSQKKILKRFRNVFDLAYRRYNDIAFAEVQAREARIEAALEKIRSRALAMRNSSEVGNVSTLLFSELEKMDINPSGFSIMIFDEEQDKYELWRAKEVAHQGAYETFSIKAMYDKFDQYVPGFGEELKSAWTKGNPFFIGEFRGEKRVSFLQANREMANYSDEVFEKMKKGWPNPTFWHLVFFKYGWFGVLQNEQLIKENLLLIHRFAEVFDFAYTRFLDLKNAEAQAREAKTETALERVRSRTMGMQKSEELKEVIRVVYEQFVHLKINVDHAGFVVDYKPNGDWHFWIADEQDIPSKITHPYFESVWANQFNEAKEKGADFFATNLNFEEKNKFYNELLSYVPGLPEESKDFYLNCPGLAGSTVLLENVGLYIENFSGIPYSNEDNNTLMRFGKVFQQTYTRFLDLQKAEAQAREAQIEAALERVRSRSLAMHKTDELQDVVRVVAEELKNAGVILDTGGAVICTYFQDSKDVIHWTATEDSAHPSVPYLLPYFKDELFDEAWASKERRDDYFAKEFSFDVKNAFFKYAFKHSDYRQLPDEYKKIILESKSHGLAWAWSKNSAIMIPSIKGELPSEEEKEILIRFAKVFEQSFIRFLDLQKAEVQAREAQIEASLEKVRSRSLAMHKTEELGEVVTVVVEKLRELNIPVNDGVAIVTHIEGSKDQIEWMENPGLLSAIKFYQSYFEHPILVDYWKARYEGIDFIAPRYTAEVSQSFLNHIFEFGGYKNTPQEVKDYCLAAKTYSYSAAFQKNSSIFINDYSGRSLTEQEIDIVKRFSKVFEQAYIRFLDLQKAEAQAGEAKIEVALERVRSRTMAMQRSDELAETVSVLFKQLLDLGVKSTQLRTCGIATFKENQPLGEIWITDITGEIISDSFDAPYDEAPAYKTIYSKWKTGEKFLELNLKGDEFLEHLSFVKKYSAVPNINLDEIKKLYKEIFFYVIYFSQGYLFVISYEALTEYHEIFKRFGALFHQTYTRFLDFKKVEAQNKIIQAENERKTKELEDARNLQLAMLPKELPQLQHLDIVVYMKTATEVGGDYYDFNVDADGTLTVLVGDATGHGMMSGMMVSIMKSFFISNRSNIELKSFFENSNNSIKDMHLGRLMMSCMGVQITSEKIIATNAGMPSLLYFRNKSKKAGEFVSNNLPLGGMKGTKYLLKEITYEKGDTLLLISDGLAELKNVKDEQYGYERVKEEFRSVAQKSPNEIVEHLKHSAAQWIKGIEPDDDVTFVVIKVK